VFACSWPAYVVGDANFTDIAQHCNYWRAWDDISDDWDSVTSISNWWDQNQDILIPAAGPGHWNDPDQLILGDFSLSTNEMEVQMALWSIYSAPLLMSNDLRYISDDARDILQNAMVIAVNQLGGKQGSQVMNQNGIQWYTKNIGEDLAVAIFYTSGDGNTIIVSTTFEQIGWPSSSASIFDCFSQARLGLFNTSFSVDVNPHGVRLLWLRASTKSPEMPNFGSYISKKK